MPLYSFLCPSCGAGLDEFAPVGTVAVRCQCGADAVKLILAPQVVIGFHDRAVNHGASAEYDRWFYSDGCQEKLKSGEYRIATAADRAEFGQEVKPEPSQIPDHAIKDAMDYAEAEVKKQAT